MTQMTTNDDCCSVGAEIGAHSPWACDGYANPCPKCRHVLNVHTESKDEGAPVGWAEWEAWQDSDDCAKALQMIGEDLRRMGIDTDPKAPGGFWVGMSLQNLASCAFAAGMEVGRHHAQVVRPPDVAAVREGE